MAGCRFDCGPGFEQILFWGRARLHLYCCDKHSCPSTGRYNRFTSSILPDFNDIIGKKLYRLGVDIYCPGSPHWCGFPAMCLVWDQEHVLKGRRDLMAYSEYWNPKNEMLPREDLQALQLLKLRRLCDSAYT